MTTTYTVQIKAVITLNIETDGPEPTAEQVGKEVGRYATLKNGYDFDSDEFEIIGVDEETDSQRTPHDCPADRGEGKCPICGDNWSLSKS